MHSTNYVIKFVLIMTALVAVLLAFLSTGLKGVHDKNEAIYNKRAILEAVANKLDVPPSDMSDEEVAEVFKTQIDQKVFDMKGNVLTQEEVEALGYKGGLAEHVDTKKERKKSDADRVLPWYTFASSAGEKYYIINVRGNGLWDEIWGNVALESDLNTIAGVSFDHKAETPGLGAEIKDNPAFPKMFEAKKIFGPDGEYKSVDVVKGGVKDKMHQVDAISGATITAVGVGEMMVRGVDYYRPAFNQVKNAN